MWQEIRDPHNNKLLFKFDPIHDRVQIGSRGVYHEIDLTLYRPPAPSSYSYSSNSSYPSDPSYPSSD